METDRELALKWWNSITFEEKFYKVILWLKSKNRNVTDRHPNSLSCGEIEEIGNLTKDNYESIF